MDNSSSDFQCGGISCQQAGAGLVVSTIFQFTGTELVGNTVRVSGNQFSAVRVGQFAGGQKKIVENEIRRYPSAGTSSVFLLDSILQIFFSGCKTTSNMAFGFVVFQNFFDLCCQRGIDLLKTLCNVFMYCGF